MFFFFSCFIFRQKLESNKTEIEHLKKVLDSKEDLEKRQVGKFLMQIMTYFTIYRIQKNWLLVIGYQYIDGLVLDCSNSTANTLQSCTISYWYVAFDWRVSAHTCCIRVEQWCILISF